MGAGEVVERDADRVVVRLRGEHDASSVDALSQIVARAMALDDVNVFVDLSEVEFMSAATVGVILRARGFLGLRARSLTLRFPSSCARRVLEMCWLGDLLMTGPVDAALVSTTRGGLGTCVAAPATDRGDRDSHAPKPTPGSAPHLVGAGTVAASSGEKLRDVHVVNEPRALNVAGRGSA
jgi:anti-anti-sigma factor